MHIVLLILGIVALFASWVLFSGPITKTPALWMEEVTIEEYFTRRPLQTQKKQVNWRLLLCAIGTSLLTAACLIGALVSWP